MKESGSGWPTVSGRQAAAAPPSREAAAKMMRWREGKVRLGRESASCGARIPPSLANTEGRGHISHFRLRMR